MVTSYLIKGISNESAVQGRSGIIEPRPASLLIRLVLQIKHRMGPDYISPLTESRKLVLILLLRQTFRSRHAMRMCPNGAFTPGAQRLRPEIACASIRHASGLRRYQSSSCRMPRFQSSNVIGPPAS